MPWETRVAVNKPVNIKAKAKTGYAWSIKEEHNPQIKGNEEGGGGQVSGTAGISLSKYGFYSAHNEQNHKDQQRKKSE